MIWCAKAIRSADMGRAALILGWLGAGNVMLARYAGECTMNSADRLLGLWLTLILYALALALLWRGRLGRWDLLAALPLGLLWLWQAAMALRFAYGVGQGQSACTMLQGGTYDFDGREAMFAALWLATCLALPLALAAISARKWGRA